MSKHSKSEWVKYDEDFVSECEKNEWYWEFANDDFPVLNPAKKKFKGAYHVGIWDAKHLDITITASCTNTKNVVKKLLNKKGIQFTIYTEGEFEAILLVDRKLLKKVILALDLKRKKRKCPSKETLEKLAEGRKKYQESLKKDGG